MFILIGSFKKVNGIGWVGGYGIFVDSRVSFGAYLPSESRQTNNTAEATAARKAHRIFPAGKVASCTVSNYVFLGATGAARRWTAHGWVGSSGPVSNEQLGESLLRDNKKNHTLLLYLPPSLDFLFS